MGSLGSITLIGIGVAVGAFGAAQLTRVMDDSEQIREVRAVNEDNLSALEGLVSPKDVKIEYVKSEAYKGFVLTDKKGQQGTLVYAGPPGRQRISYLPLEYKIRPKERIAFMPYQNLSTVEKIRSPSYWSKRAKGHVKKFLEEIENE